MSVEYKEEDDLRDYLIKKSRDVLRLSKECIYTIHRGDFEKAKTNLDKAEDVLKNEMLPKCNVSYFRNLGSLTAALEEWCEAQIFYSFRKEGM